MRASVRCTVKPTPPGTEQKRWPRITTRYNKTIKRTIMFSASYWYEICCITLQTSRRRLTVWHADMWQVLRSFNVWEGLVQAVQALYKNSSCAVFFNSRLVEFYKTTVGVRRRCLPLPILFNLFLEKIMHETGHDHQTSIFTGSRNIIFVQIMILRRRCS